MIWPKINALITYRLIFVFVLYNILCSIVFAVSSPVPISQLSENICIRICCIARLKQLMGRIRLLCEHENGASIAVDSSLLELWNDFSSFRFVDDLEFQTMFLRRAFSAAISLVHSEDLSMNFKGVETSTGSLEQVLQAIDMCTDILERSALSCKAKSDFSAEQYYVREDISAESVTRRFFQIRRLQQAVIVLQNLTSDKVPLRDDRKKTVQTNCLEELLSVIEHPRIFDAITSMIENNSTAPLLAVVNEMMRFRFIGDDQFFKEMLLVMFNAYKSIVMQYMHDVEVQDRIDLELETAVYRNEQIDQLTLEKLLEGIDTVTLYMNIVLNDIHMKSGSQESKIKSYLKMVSAVACLGLFAAWCY